MKGNQLLLLLICTMMIIYSHQKQKYRLNINNNVDHHLLEICLFARADNKRASHILYMQPHTQRSLDLPFCCAEIKVSAWLSSVRSTLLCDESATISIAINKKSDGTLEVCRSTIKP